MTKKILAMFLAVMMVVSLLATSVYAEEAEVWCPVEDGGYHYHIYTENEKNCEVYDETAENEDYRPVVVEATCTKEGYTLLTCKGCNKRFAVDPTEKKAHNAVLVEEGKLATCTEEGYEAGSKVCADCGALLEGGRIDPLGHDWHATNSVDCESETGKIIQACSRCDATQEIDPAGEHDWTWTLIQEATATANGKANGHCSTCGKDIEIVVYYNHECADELYKVDEVPATCEGEGKKEHYKCAVCGKLYWDEAASSVIANESDLEIAAHGHAPYRTDLNCSNNREQVYCKYCHELYVFRAAHTYDDGEVTLEPTCTEAGVLLKTCSVCGNTTEEEIAALGHDWNAGEITTEPTCTEKGVKTYTCSACEATKEEEVAALGHDWDAPASCVHTAVCNLCGEEVEGDHNWVLNPALSTAPECLNNGLNYYGCETCGGHYTEPVEAVGHLPYTVKVPATCISKGYEYTICLRDCCVNSGNTTKSWMDDLTRYDLNNFMFLSMQIGSATYYFTGKVANKPYYMATSKNVADAVQVYLEGAYKLEYEGDRLVGAKTGYYLYFFDANGVKTYLTIEKSGSYTNAKLTTEEPKNLFNWNETVGVWTVDVDGSEYWLGTYGTFNTISANGLFRLTTTQSNPQYPSALAPAGVDADGGVYLLGEVTLHNGVDANQHPSYVVSLDDPECTLSGRLQICCTKCAHKVVDEVLDPLGHTPGEPYYDAADSNCIPVTCTQNGVYKQVCTECDHILPYVAIESRGHNEVEDEDQYVAPTCQMPGKRVFICKDCQCGDACACAFVREEPIAASEEYHDWGEPAVNLGSHTNHNVSAVWTCSICGEQKNATEIEQEDGSILKHWQYCDYVFEDLDAAQAQHNGHIGSTSTGVKENGSCVKDAVLIYRCSECDKDVWVKAEYDSDGHPYRDHVWAEAQPGGYIYELVDIQVPTEVLASVTELGYATPVYWTSTVSGTYYFRLVDADGKVVDIDEIQESYGESLGYYYPSSDYDNWLDPAWLYAGENTITLVAGEEYCFVWVDTEVTLELYTEYEIGKQVNETEITGLIDSAEGVIYNPTCYGDGYQYVGGCTRPGCELYNENAGSYIVLPQLDHEENHDACFVPNNACPGSAGLIDGDWYYESCQFCGEKHYHEGAGVIATGDGPICTDYKYNIYKCYCGEIHALYFYGNYGHKTHKVNVVEPTCTTAGSYDLFCDLCGEIVGNGTIDKLPHLTWEGKVIDNNCSEDGGDRHCNECDQDVTVHDWAYQGHFEATCTEKGYDYYLCTRCKKEGFAWYDDEPAHGHDYTIDGEQPNYVDYVAPTYEAPGKAVVECKHCGLQIEEPLAQLSGGKLTLDAEEYTYGSRITLVVSLSNVNASINAWSAEVYFNRDLVTFVGYNGLGEDFFVNATDPAKVADGHPLYISGVVPGDEEAQVGETDLIELEFIVNKNIDAAVGFGISDIIGINNNDELVDLGNTSTPSTYAHVAILGDANHSGSVNYLDSSVNLMFDLNAGLKMIYAEEYCAAFDLDYNGIIDANDLIIAYNLYLGSIDADDVLLSNVSEAEAELLGFKKYHCDHKDCGYTSDEPFANCPVCRTPQELH